jgi:4-amino-4-deoxy-L-arabinose transferase-like glycosyltransferase
MKNSPRNALVLLLLLAFGLRIYRLPQLSLRADEAATVFQARVTWSELLQMLSDPGPHQPLYMVLLHGWMKVAGDGELAVRFLTLVSGVLLVPLMYVLARRLFAREARQVALWTCLLVAINPLLIWDAQDNRMYPVLAVLNLASFYFSLSILEDRGDWKHWLGYVASTTLAFFTHYLAVFVVITENVVWASLVWSQPQRRRRLGRWIIAQSAVVLLFSPWLPRATTTVAQFTTDFLPAVGAGEMLRRTLVGLSLGRSVDAQLGPFLALGFVLTLILGCLPYGVRPKVALAPASGGFTGVQSLILLLIYLVIPWASVAIFSAVRFPIFDERYIMLSLPPYLLLLGRGLSSLSSAGLRRWVAALGFVSILVVTSYSLRNYYFVPQYMKGIDWRSYVARLLECAEPGDVLIQNYPDPGLTYHLRDRMSRVLLPTGYPADVPRTEAELRHLSETHPRMWLQPAKYERWDADGLVETWMDRNGFKVAEEHFGQQRLALYWPLKSYEQKLVPVDAVLGGSIRLLGYTLESEAEAQSRGVCDPVQFRDRISVHPGDRLYLVLLWQASAKIPESYTVFTHLYDEQERIWGQEDSPPVSGSYPTSLWSPGEKILDRYQILVDPKAPPGEYRLAVGMYDPNTGDRLRVNAGGEFLMSEDRIMLAIVQASE